MGSPADPLQHGGHADPPRPHPRGRRRSRQRAALRRRAVHARALSAGARLPGARRRAASAASRRPAIRPTRTCCSTASRGSTCPAHAEAARARRRARRRRREEGLPDRVAARRRRRRRDRDREDRARAARERGRARVSATPRWIPWTIAGAGAAIALGGVGVLVRRQAARWTSSRPTSRRSARPAARPTSPIEPLLARRARQRRAQGHDRDRR